MNQQLMNKIMDVATTTEEQAAVMYISKIFNGQTNLCWLDRKTLFRILFDYIKRDLIDILSIIIYLFVEMPILVLMRKLDVDKKLAQHIYRKLRVMLFEIKSVCFYIICIVLTLISPRKYLGKIAIMVLQNTMDVFKKF